MGCKMMSLEDAENRDTVLIFSLHLRSQYLNIRSSMVRFIIRRDKIEAVNPLDFKHLMPYGARKFPHCVFSSLSCQAIGQFNARLQGTAHASPCHKAEGTGSKYFC